jgi:ubiquinone/menaquinone biosynthesis C-methylase UbiE
MSDVERQARQVFGERAAFYTTSAIHADQALLEHLVDLARLTPSDRVLDVATGTGHTALAFAPHVREVVGCDLTPEMLAEAEKLRAAQGATNLTLTTCSALDLPFADGEFDVVTCRRAAHHFSDVRRALGEMRRVLKPGGRLIVDDRSVPEDDFVDATMNRLDLLHDESHVRQYRPSEWAALLAETGYEVELIEPYTRHRPLTSLTASVAADRVAEIHSIVAALTPEQRAAMSVDERDGETYTDHWYLTAVGVRPSS